ncbi:MAG: hypothetical protein AAF828_02470 [Bacteroidota bacterium]
MSMEQGHLTNTQEKDAELIEVMIKKVVSGKGFEEIKANVDGYETPSKLRDRKQEDKFFIPDVTGKINGRKSYFELGMKTTDERELVTKWRILSNLANYKNGKLYLAVPRGHMAFTNRIVADYQIKAEIVKI